MFRTRFFCTAAFFLLLAAPSPVTALPILLLSSSSDLTQLVVGSTVQIDVTLAQTDPDDLLFVLYSRALFPSSHFQAIPDPSYSSGLTPGAILPQASQVSIFNALSSLTAGAATGNFADQFLSPLSISTNGRYYSFELTAIAAGTGAIRFDAANTFYAGNSSGLSLAPLPTSGPLSYTIAPVAAVPEPSTVVLLTCATMVALGRKWHVGAIRHDCAHLRLNGSRTSVIVSLS